MVSTFSYAPGGGAIYDIPASPFLWLCPCLAITGLLILCVALMTRRKLPLVPGLVLLAAGAIPDRDLSLLVGGILYALAIYLFIKK